ncbi:MAG: helix-turn-helix domain-containing protein [Candidatus Accumulibacter sp.]|jgi:IclR family pca regulon transcriptional regulator|nr:helix-turn-helix domain-containing protein [Accumulibacter sp.]
MIDRKSPLNKKDWIAGLEKGLQIIEAFNDSHPRLTASTAARRTGITRTATRRYLRTLEHLGYVESDGHLFWLSPRVLRLGWSYFDSAGLPRAVQPHLQKLSLTLGGAAYFAVMDEDDVVFVARDGTNLVQNVGYVLGARIAANLSSAGIAILSTYSDKEVEQWLVGRKFIPYSPFTAITEKAIRQLIDSARVNGYAVLEQQIAQRVRGIAIPVRTHAGEVVGAISVSLPMGKETTENAVARSLPLLREVEYTLLVAF